MCSEIEFFGQWVNGPLVSSTVFSALSEPFGLKRRCNSIYTLLQSCLFMEEGEFSSQFQLPTSNNHPNAANIGGGKNGRRCLLRLTLLTTTKTRVLMLEKTSCKISWKPWPDRSCNFVIFPSIRHPLHLPHCITDSALVSLISTLIWWVEVLLYLRRHLGAQWSNLKLWFQPWQLQLPSPSPAVLVLLVLTADGNP